MRSRIARKSLLGMLLVLGVAAAVAAPAGAASTTSVTPNPVTVTPDQTTASVNVTYTGLVSGQLVFIDVFKKSITDPTFNVAEDCGAYSGITPNGIGTGGTSSLTVFRGQDPAEEAWGCYAPGDTVPAGITGYTTCYVRVTDTSRLNYDNDSQEAFTFAVSGGVVPEAPVTILLPVVGTLAALAGFVLIRRRQAAAV